MFFKRTISVFILALVLSSSIIPGYAAESSTEIKIIFNGEQLHFDVSPVIMDGRTLVPARAIFEKLGYTVDWDGTKQRVIAKKDTSIIQIDIGDPLVILNDYASSTTLDVPAQIINDRTMVPLRFIATAADYDVLWDNTSNTVYIESIFDGDIAPRPFQSVAMLEDELVFTNGHIISHDGKIFEEVDFASGNSLQIYNHDLYYRNSEFYLYKANVETYETAIVTKIPVADTTVLEDKLYYKKMGDKTHALFQADLDGGNEKLVINQPCGDYRILGDKIYYIHMHSQNLIEYSMTTTETKVIYDGFTTGIDISPDNNVYYGMAIYKDESTPLDYEGIGIYHTNDTTFDQILKDEIKSAGDIWVLGSNLFYQTETSNNQYDLYRYSLKYGYNIKILSDIYRGTEIHGKRIFYYPIKDDAAFHFAPEGEAALYVANTRGTNAFPLMSLVFSKIGWYAIETHVPENEHFNEYIERDIENYISEKYGNDTAITYFLLSKQAETDMNGGARFYVWAILSDAEGTAIDAGVISMKAVEKEGFQISSFVSKNDFLAEPSCVNGYPKMIRKRILELAE